MQKIGATAGIIAPLVLGTAIAALTIVEFPFMRSLGWDPLRRPTFDWPSGLALSPAGWIMTLTFLVCGPLFSMFA